MSHFNRGLGAYLPILSRLAQPYASQSEAARQLRKLDRQQQDAIRDSVTNLSRMPNCHNVKALTNHDCGYRLRVGDYRVLFDWEGAIKVVDIQEVRKRNERTY
jgi:mRNA interferase RelE/StbE